MMALYLLPKCQWRSDYEAFREMTQGRHIRVLVLAGMDINAPDRSGETAIDHAAHRGNGSHATDLWENGAFRKTSIWPRVLACTRVCEDVARLLCEMLG